MSKTKPAKKKPLPPPKKSAAVAEPKKKPTLLARLEEVDLKRIHPSPTNPRKVIAKDELAELTASVKEQGVLQALLLRPHPKKKGEHELVCGERRWRAATAAGLKTVPATIRDMTDDQVIVAQLTENAQRADVHPLEEADAYHELQQKHGHTVDDLVAEVGKSKGHIYSRLKLCTLGKVARQAFLDERMSIGTAVFLARVSDAQLQEKAAKEIAKGYGKDQPWSGDRARRHIEQHCMLVLERAPFDTADGTLVPAAGACGACPKRTGNQGELFGAVEREDLCTDPGCFESKKEASWKLKAEKAAIAGHKVLSEKETKKIVHEYGSIDRKAGLTSLDETCHQDPKFRTYRQLLGKKVKETSLTVARNPRDGAALELVETKGLTKLLKAAGHDFKKEKQERQQRTNESYKKEREKHEAESRGLALAVGELVACAETRGADRSLLLQVVQVLAEVDALEGVVGRRGWAGENDFLYGDELVEKIRPELDKMSDAQLCGLLFEATLHGVPFSIAHDTGHTKEFRKRCADAGVDLDDCLERGKVEPPPQQHPALAIVCVVCMAAPAASCKLTEGRKKGQPCDPHDERVRAAETLARPDVVAGKCRKCGCTEGNACVDENEDACSWVEPDLCSACA